MVDPQPKKSYHELEPLERGAGFAREGYDLQDNVAAKMVLLMIESSELAAVWCDTHDDITLVWGDGDDTWFEFIQVKGEDPKKLWSMAKLIERDGKAVGTSILERSFANERGREPCRFRIVTTCSVNSDLAILRLSFTAPDREGHSEAIHCLAKQVTKRFGDNYYDSAVSWLTRVSWDVVHSVDSVRANNLLQLGAIVAKYSRPLLSDQLGRFYEDCILKMVNAAACANWGKDPSKKKLLRKEVISWFMNELANRLSLEQGNWPSLAEGGGVDAVVNTMPVDRKLRAAVELLTWVARKPVWQLGFFLNREGGSSEILEQLPRLIPPKTVFFRNESKSWEALGQCYLQKGEYVHAKDIFYLLYCQQMQAQTELNMRLHKGSTLYWLYETHRDMGNTQTALRYLLFTLCEDAVQRKGTLPGQELGAFRPLIEFAGLSGVELSHYADRIYSAYERDPAMGMFPEWLLLQLETDWSSLGRCKMKPDLAYCANTEFLRFLMTRKSVDASGVFLGAMANYVMGLLPGRTIALQSRQAGTLEVDEHAVEVLSRLKCQRLRYDWSSASTELNVAAIEAFCRELDRTSPTLGVVFCETVAPDVDTALRANAVNNRQLVVPVTCEDVKNVNDGSALISLLCRRLEEVR